MRQISATQTPSVPDFKMSAFQVRENFDAFIGFQSARSGKMEQKTPTKTDPGFGDQITRSIRQRVADLDCYGHFRLRHCCRKWRKAGAAQHGQDGVVEHR